MSIRLLMKRLRISKLDMGSSSLTLTLPEDTAIRAEHLVRLIHASPRKYRLLPDNRLRIDLGKLSFPEDMDRVKKEVTLLADNKG